MRGKNISLKPGARFVPGNSYTTVDTVFQEYGILGYTKPPYNPEGDDVAEGEASEWRRRGRGLKYVP